MSDVFHTGSPESTLWEFKHGNGNFKRGDLAGLREIKRRASRHALIHRDSFSSPHKPSISQPGTPAEPVVDPAELRLQALEHSVFDLHARLSRTEESNTALSAKCHVLNESLVKCHQVRRSSQEQNMYTNSRSGALTFVISFHLLLQIQTILPGVTVSLNDSLSLLLILTSSSNHLGEGHSEAT